MSEPWKHSPNDPGLSPDQIVALGEIVIIWGHIEADCQHIIWEYLKDDVLTSATITSGMTLDAKTRLLSQLSDQLELDPTLKRDIGSLILRIDQLRGVRNDLIHGFWINARPRSYKRTLRDGHHPYDTDYSPPSVDLVDFRDLSSRLCHDLWMFMGQKMIMSFPIVDDDTLTAGVATEN